MKIEPALPAAHESCPPAETVQGPLEVVIVKGEERSPYSRNVAQVPVLAVARSQVRSGGRAAEKGQREDTHVYHLPDEMRQPLGAESYSTARSSVSERGDSGLGRQSATRRRATGRSE